MTRASGTTTLRARLGVVAAVFLASMLLVVGLSSLMIRSWSRADADRTDTRAVADAVSDLRLAYSDQETGIRGYLLGNDVAFLAPYDDGREAEARAMAALRSMNPGIDGLLNQLRLVERRADEWRALVATPAIDRAAQPDESIGMAAFDNLRVELDQLDQLVVDELAQLERRLQQVRQSALAVLLGSAVFAVGGTILVVALFRRWVIQPLSSISASALSLSQDSSTQLPHFEALELDNVTCAIDTLQTALAHERDRAVTAYRGLEQSAVLALQVRSELADELGEMPPGWCADSLLVPADGVVAGDCFDLGLLDAHRLYLVMIDVTGHGAAAALNALKAKSQLRAGLRSRSTPGGALAILSRETCDDQEADLLTAFVAIIDLGSGTCSYASAGHPPPLLRVGDTVTELSPTGPLVGAFAATWTTETVEIPHDATLLVHTDGATETVGEDRERFGDDRLRTLVEQQPDPALLVEAIAAAVTEFRTGPRSDDLTLLAIQRDACDPELSPQTDDVGISG